MSRLLLLLLLFLPAIGLTAQEASDQSSDQPLKLDHAEPLYIDLIRDLGAHKGEKEWNVGFGLSDNKTFDSYEFLVEYEWAVADRWGLEIELPFSFYSPITGIPNDSLPANKLESLQLATQWTFWVSEPHHTSMALGYMQEFEFSDFRNFGNPLIEGAIYNPFLVAAKGWQKYYHTLLYTGPILVHHFDDAHLDFIYELHANFHYMIPDSHNFVGLEINNYVDNEQWDCTLRPQMRLDISNDIKIGIVAGIPITRTEQGLSMFTRLIWEP
ncbi:HAEPLYID family protein [Carboxylicivirga sp. M1479]|uniref:HAEPLYID family protein n=1 Tax=Carboxylicivirga sp. M1479 TaxID=2594476 RepID=UPI0011787A1B|nr:HAEPLYID family protein [Carboxylicivirga sp. M1479]TRX66442.1 phosphoribosylformylglycinamidine synthase [Carboxylicivirga sp. M1479]